MKVIDSTIRKHFAEKLVDELPHGSGLDCNWYYDVPSSSNTVRLSNSYHCMKENGYHDGYADFTLIVDCLPDIQNLHGFRLQFNGRESQKLNYKYGLREYLEETFGWALADIITYGKVIN